MTSTRVPGSLPPARVPTLTEALSTPLRVEPQSPPRLTEVLQAPPPMAPTRPSTPSTGAASAEHDNALAQRLLADMQQHLDRVLEDRIAAAIEPLLAQWSSRLLEAARGELASSLREAMAVALARELSRHRGDPGPR